MTEEVKPPKSAEQLYRERLDQPHPLEEQRLGESRAYRIEPFDLGIARTDFFVAFFEGEYLLVLQLDGACSIRLNEPSNSLIDLQKVRWLRTPFNKIYITNVAQAGKSLQLLIGRKGFFEADHWDLAQLVRGVALEEIRTPTTFKTATISAASDTAIWTPTSGKKWRLMGALITIPASCILATAGVTSLILDDGATALNLQFDVYLGTAAGTFGAIVIPLDLKPNGLLSAAANNVLNGKMSTALSGGAIRVSVWGTEE